VFWRSDANPAVLPVDARAASVNDGNAFDLWRVEQSVTVVKHAGIEHVLVGDGNHRIQLDVRGRSLLEGPAHLRYELAAFVGVEDKVATLHRFIARQRLGRFPRALFPLERRARRWLTALQAIDGRLAGATPREIAVALFGDGAVRRDWDGPSDYLRSRVRRAIATGEQIVDRGYLKLLAS
jgi:hypothetical protein